MNESQLWKKINSLQKTQKLWHFTRIESATIRGIPDLNCLINGCEFWLELKSKESKNLGLSNYQINWHIKHQKCGGKVFILLHTIISNHIDKNQGIFRLILESRTLSDLFEQLEKLLKK